MRPSIEVFVFVNVSLYLRNVKRRSKLPRDRYGKISRCLVGNAWKFLNRFSAIFLCNILLVCDGVVSPSAML